MPRLLATLALLAPLSVAAQGGADAAADPGRLAATHVKTDSLPYQLLT